MEIPYGKSWIDIVRDVVREELHAFKTEKKQTIEPTKATIRGIRGLAAYCGISTATAQRLKSKGIVPYSQIGNRIYFCPSEVDEALKVNKL